jgi:hypothetical protein
MVYLKQHYKKKIISKNMWLYFKLRQSCGKVSKASVEGPSQIIGIQNKASGATGEGPSHMVSGAAGEGPSRIHGIHKTVSGATGETLLY